MTRDSQLPGDPPEEPGTDEQGPRGSLGTTSPGLLAGLFLAGVVLGRLVRPVSLEIGDSAPQVGWVAVLTLFFLAAILAYLAWQTRRTLRALRVHQAVNRLVLAKSCAIAGALVAGGYLGYAIAWLGEVSELAEQRLLHSALAAVAGGLIVAGSLALERACRVSPGGPNT